ncbi:hypothetical protein RFI_18280 [Reticulomyxa filosa]|uniref:Uncharacterized protein n=1 Tax=Reticulomyxa filosa TaxID=46433 RepID=X6MZR1_RETFI|nr:hypothetical protein RFI_18280 [Reticulomyxa filosa]|eukprot:ETO18959.1 hypothetical protein RFI_18280 [Reticulomyxa filosa]
METARITCCFLYIGKKKVVIVPRQHEQKYLEKIESYLSEKSESHGVVLSNVEKRRCWRRSRVEFIFAKNFNSITVGIFAEVKKKKKKIICICMYIFILTQLLSHTMNVKTRMEINAIQKKKKKKGIGK